MKIVFTLSYDGKKFHGFQKQINISTIQGEFEKNLEKLFQKKIITIGSGRTDSGVHADRQILTANLDTQIVNKIGLHKLAKVINALLPDEIRIVHLEKINPSFHPRFSAKIRYYRYQIFLLDSDQYSPYFKADELNYYHTLTYPIKIEKLKNYFNKLEGSHDFTSFSSSEESHYQKRNYQRIIYKIDLILKERKLWIDIYANGFLRSMVRSIIGNILFLYSKGQPSNNIAKILKAKDRNLAKQRVPAKALFLKKVFYTNIFGDEDKIIH